MSQGEVKRWILKQRDPAVQVKLQEWAKNQDVANLYYDYPAHVMCVIDLDYGRDDAEGISERLPDRTRGVVVDWDGEKEVLFVPLKTPRGTWDEAPPIDLTEVSDPRGVWVNKAHVRVLSDDEAGLT